MRLCRASGAEITVGENAQESGRLAVRRVGRAAATSTRDNPVVARPTHRPSTMTSISQRPEGPSAQPCTKSSQMVSMTYRICLMPVQAWVGGYRMRAA